MSKILVIVESPGKIKKIGEYLGSDYIVKASFGHCRDLDSKSLSIDVDDNFKPYYTIIPGKNKVVRELRELQHSCKEVILAADEDREGEMIASSLADLLHLKDPKRIVFHEITKKSIKNAIENPTKINYNMVYAQQARRLLDRLVGYRISPILWKMLAGGKSAGRVQSIVLRIIIDKEIDIEKSISEPYFKTTSLFNYKKTNFKGVLKKGKKQYHFKTYEKAEKYLSKMNKETKFKVLDVSNRKVNRKAPPPFITSTMQQDASSKIRFPVKKTMTVAQKLYEAGLITYMRTDSTNLSKDAIDACEKYIVENYGKEYSKPKNFTKKGKGAQEAHECIRPTKLELKDISDKFKGDYLNDAIKLYNLIWNRTMASQMSDAIVNLQTIKTDVLNDDKSVLPKKTIFESVLETIDFDGFLILYQKVKEEDEDENEEGSVSIKEGSYVKMKEILVTEEYTKPPLRYNEAGLVKYLEKNGIGRPSTYASIISKVIDRSYVEIKNVEGVKKDSRTITLNSKFEMKLKTKEIVIGKEKNKLVPTDMGIKVNEFMVNNFKEIMNIKFTATLESYLDKIAQGTAKWYNILDHYYKTFNPIVEKLQLECKEINKMKVNEELIGIDEETDMEIYKGVGKYGPYVKTIIDKEKNKFKFASLNDIKYEDVNLETAIELLEYPKLLGKIVNAQVFLHKGKFGFYLKKGKQSLSIKDKPIEEVDIKYAKELFSKGDPYSLKSFKIKNKNIYLKKGQYGFYLQLKGKSKKNINVSLPTSIDIDDLNTEMVFEILAHRFKK